MTKRTAVWAIMGLWATALVLGISTHALGVEERGVPADSSPQAQNQQTTPPQGAPDNQGDQGGQGVRDNGGEGVRDGNGGEGTGDQGNGGEGTGDQGGGQQGQFMFFALMIGALLLLWVFGGRKSRAAEKQRQAMLANIKKGDRVTSIGGIIGTVVDVRENEVVVKVDDAGNTRLRFVRKAINSVGTEPEEGQGERK